MVGKGLLNVIAITLLGCKPVPMRTEHVTGNTMATNWDITIRDAWHSIDKAPFQKRLDELEQTFSNWRSDSAVSKWNQSSSTEFQSVPRDLAIVADLAIRAARESEGALDVTIAPLIDLWGFGPHGPIKSPPTDEAIHQAQQHCGWQKLEVQLDPPMLRKTDPELTINLSTIVEGYAADKLAAMLRAQGWKDYLVEVGSALVASDGPWFLGVQTPHAPQGDALAGLPISHTGVSTAGTYRKHFDAGEQQFSHIIDPSNGRPVSHHLASVSVFAESAAVADAWDTALLVLGPIQGRALAQRLNLRAVFVEERN